MELPSTSGDVYTSALVGGLVDVAPIGAGIVAKHYVDNYERSGRAPDPPQRHAR